MRTLRGSAPQWKRSSNHYIDDAQTKYDSMSIAEDEDHLFSSAVTPPADLKSCSQIRPLRRNRLLLVLGFAFFLSDRALLGTTNTSRMSHQSIDVVAYKCIAKHWI